jgi:hypothetical protein
MDNITRYYLRKSQLRAPDEFHHVINPADLEHLQWSRAYLVVTPMAMVGGFHLLKLMWESGTFTKNFASYMFRARQQYQNSDQNWDPKAATYKTSKETPTEPSRDIYQDVIKEREFARKAQLESKPHTEVSFQRVVRNIDPFERKRRLAMSTNPAGNDFKMSNVLSTKEARE